MYPGGEHNIEEDILSRAGYCDVCCQEVWLDDAGACPNGHGRESITRTREATPSVQPLITPAPPQGTKTPLLSTIIIVIAVIVLLGCACPAAFAFMIPLLAT